MVLFRSKVCNNCDYKSTVAAVGAFNKVHTVAVDDAVMKNACANSFSSKIQKKVKSQTHS